MSGLSPVSPEMTGAHLWPARPLAVLDLFAGLGGFSLGLERSGGFRTVAFCEIELYCQAVLRQHWPGVPCYDDVRTLSASRLATDGISVDVITGGFPCQDISRAGKGAGIRGGQRSCLWSEIARLAREIRPRWLVVENVEHLLASGGDFDAVLSSLASIGYHAEWHCIPAAALGAPHQRDRVWVIAWPGEIDPYPGRDRRRKNDTAPVGSGSRGTCRLDSEGGASDTAGPGCGQGDPATCGIFLSHLAREIDACRDFWAAEPRVLPLADGIPGGACQIRAYGNSLIPQIPEVIGRAIMQVEQDARARGWM